jgi:hypothetical protein
MKQWQHFLKFLWSNGLNLCRVIVNATCLIPSGFACQLAQQRSVLIPIRHIKLGSRIGAYFE